MTPLTLVNALEESEPDAGSGLLGTLLRWWGRLGENHPPVTERIAILDRMNGGTCPRVRLLP